MWDMPPRGIFCVSMRAFRSWTMWSSRLQRVISVQRRTSSGMHRAVAHMLCHVTRR